MIEKWRDVVGYEGMYQVSSLGRVKTIKTQLIRKQTVTHRGYMRLCLHSNGSRFKYHVHRLVALAFIKNINNKPFVNHMDGLKTNNVIENLEWCTASENKYHAHKFGLAGNGENAHSAKLNWARVGIIREISAFSKNTGCGAPVNWLAKCFNVAPSTISSVISMESWTKK